MKSVQEAQLNARIHNVLPGIPYPRCCGTGLTPGNIDILFGRGKRISNLPGNRLFYATVDANVDAYDMSVSKFDKGTIVRDIVKVIRKYGGRFLKESSSMPDMYEEVSESEAQQKVRQALRTGTLARKKRQNSITICRSPNTADRKTKTRELNPIASSESRSDRIRMTLEQRARFDKTMKSVQGANDNVESNILHRGTCLTPGNTDVLCGRGRQIGNLPGNRLFYATISANVDAYDMSVSKFDKGTIVHEIIKKIQENGGRFLKESSSMPAMYEEMSETEVREKVRQALRTGTLVRKKRQNSITICRSESRSGRIRMTLEQRARFDKKMKSVQDANDNVESNILHRETCLTPGNTDVLGGRGRQIGNLPGNRLFYATISANVDAYDMSASRSDKGTIVREIIKKIREYGGRFLKESSSMPDMYEEMLESEAEEKARQALRSRIRSKSQTRVRIRIRVPAELHNQLQEQDQYIPSSLGITNKIRSDVIADGALPLITREDSPLYSPPHPPLTVSRTFPVSRSASIGPHPVQHKRKSSPSLDQAPAEDRQDSPPFSTPPLTWTVPRTFPVFRNTSIGSHFHQTVQHKRESLLSLSHSLTVSPESSILRNSPVGLRTMAPSLTARGVRSLRN